MGKTTKTGAVYVALNYILWQESCSGEMRTVDYSYADITSRSILIQRVSNC